MLLQLPSSALSSDTILVDFVSGVQISTGLSVVKMDIDEGSLGCEERRRVKRQKLNENRSSYLQGDSTNALDYEDILWVRTKERTNVPGV